MLSENRRDLGQTLPSPAEHYRTLPNLLRRLHVVALDRVLNRVEHGLERRIDDDHRDHTAPVGGRGARPRAIGVGVSVPF